MSKEPYIRRSGKERFIFPSPSADGVNNYWIRRAPDGERYFWSVYNIDGVLVEWGYTSTYDHAFRAVRNFIKNNQELVYGHKEVA